MKKVEKYWWGSYTNELKDEGWIDQGSEPPYKIVRENNGKWEIIKFYTNSAIYSYCPRCGFIHPCYKNNKDNVFEVLYAPEKEYKYCPMCGENMEIELLR